MRDLIGILSLFEKWCIRLFLVFWLSETIVFIIIQGWHLKATDPREVLCDSISTGIFEAWIRILIAVTILKVIHFIISLFDPKQH